MARITLSNGETMDLNLGGNGCTVKEKPASFEVALCPRDSNGNKMGGPRRAYRGDNPRAVEAVFLRNLSDKEKACDVFAT